MSGKWNLCELDNGTMWLSDGVNGISCEGAIRLLVLLKNLAKASGPASINNGVLWLSDGSSCDMRRAVDDAESP